jgi:ureidoglycolate lyase
MADAIPLPLEPLTAAAFAPFGDVVAPQGGDAVTMNSGTAKRYAALAAVDVCGEEARAVIGLVHAQARALPFDVTFLERHPLGSQAFVPLAGTRWIVVVAESPDATPRAFLAAMGEGVNYRRGTWHHPLIALEAGWFVVIDRVGVGENCDERTLARTFRIAEFPPR